MIAVTEKEKGLASLALFSQLYDEKKDIISVIQDFLEISIIHHKDRVVDQVSLNRYLKDDYGFDIPKAVVERAIRKADFLVRVQKSKVDYVVDDSKFNTDRSSCEMKIEDIQGEVAQVINRLRANLVGKKFANIEKISDADLKRVLCTFLIEEDHSSELSQQIEQFVVLNPDLQPILQKVVQGSIIFMGLSYNSKPLEYTVIEDELTIYLDTELLFFMAGYNGETFRSLFEEFFQTVADINRINYEKRGRDLIHLKYFPEIKKEIDGYFSAAEAIVSGKKSLDTTRTAMSYIVRLAKNPSDVVTMQADFWRLVKNFSIKAEEYDEYYAPKNRKFNIESKELLDSISGEDADKEENLRYLNYVNIRRGIKPQTEFKKMGYVFLTQTQIALQLSRTVRKDSGQHNVPLAFALGELTTRLWLGLNRGFNPSVTLKNFDVIIKAQIALAKRTTQSVEKRYKDLLDTVNPYSQEEIVSRIASLRLLVPMRPEEMTTDNADVLQANDFEVFIEDKISEIKHKDFLLKEKDKEIRELEVYEEFSDSQKEENAKLRERVRKTGQMLFKKETSDWQKERGDFLRKRMKKRYAGSIILVVVMFSCISVAIVEFCMKNTWSGSVLAGLVLLYELIFGLCKNLKLIPGLQESVRFLFRKSERYKVKIQFAEQYRQKENRPVYSKYASAD